MLTLSGVLLGNAACQTMTERKMDELTKELDRRLSAVREEEKARREVEERKIKEEEARRDRSEKGRVAEERLATGDAKGALAVVEEVLAPLLEVKKDPSTGKEEKVAVGPAALEPAEHARLLLVKGNALEEIGRLDDAVLAYQEALKLDPANRGARRSLGRAFFSTKKYKQALEAWRAELADGSRDAKLLFLVGRARYEVGHADGLPQDMEAARVAFEQVLLERPSDVEAIQWLAAVAYETERYGDAERYYNAARRQSPLDAGDLEKLGRCSLALGNNARALDHFELAATLRPPSQELCFTLSRLSADLHFNARAAEWLARAYKNNPVEAPAEDRYKAGRLFVDGGRDDDALIWLTAIGERDAHFAESRSLLVKIHAAAGRLDDAITAYEGLRKVASRDGSAHLAAGGLYLRRAQLDMAADAYSRASSFPESKAESLAGLAEVSIAKRNLDGALFYYRKALEIRPGDARLMAQTERISEELAFRGPDQTSGASAAAAPAGSH
jgi:tetratricopeptide (TPR) repeat protein